MKKNEIEYLMYLENRVKALEKDLRWFIEEITLRQFRQVDLKPDGFPYCPRSNRDSKAAFEECLAPVNLV